MVSRYAGVDLHSDVALIAHILSNGTICCEQNTEVIDFRFSINMLIMYVDWNKATQSCGRMLIEFRNPIRFERKAKLISEHRWMKIAIPCINIPASTALISFWMILFKYTDCFKMQMKEDNLLKRIIWMIWPIQTFHWIIHPFVYISDSQQSWRGPRHAPIRILMIWAEYTSTHRFINFKRLHMIRSHYWQVRNLFTGPDEWLSVVSLSQRNQPEY